PLSLLRGPPDGRPRRDPEQDRPGPRVGQGPLRPAARGTGRNPDRLRLPARGAGGTGEGPRLPARGRRLHPRPDRRLRGAEVGRGLRLRTHAPPDRIPDVLQLLTERGAFGRPSSFAGRRAALKPCPFGRNPARIGG